MCLEAPEPSDFLSAPALATDRWQLKDELAQALMFMGPHLEGDMSEMNAKRTRVAAAEQQSSGGAEVAPAGSAYPPSPYCAYLLPSDACDGLKRGRGDALSQCDMGYYSGGGDDGLLLRLQGNFLYTIPDLDSSK